MIFATLQLTCDLKRDLWNQSRGCNTRRREIVHSIEAWGEWKLLLTAYVWIIYYEEDVIVLDELNIVMQLDMYKSSHSVKYVYYVICFYDLNIYFVKYILPWYTSLHSCLLQNIVESISFPIIVAIRLIVMCIYQTSNISPHFIDTDHTTDVSKSTNTSHIYHICYISYHQELFLICCRLVGIKINDRGGGNKIRLLCISYVRQLGLNGRGQIG